MKECDGSCGQALCTIPKTVTEREEASLSALAQAWGLPIAFEDGVMRTCTTTPCPFFVRGRCSVYEERPMICRATVCEACAPSLDERRAHARRVILAHRSRANGWAGIDPA